MKRTKATIRRIHFENYTFEIENKKGIKSIWLTNEDYGIKTNLVDYKATFEEAEAYIFNTYQEHIENYQEHFEDKEIPLF